MPQWIVDASVAVKWFVPEDLSDRATRLLAPGFDLIAPNLVLAEITTVLSRKAREGHVANDDASRIAEALPNFFSELVPFAPWLRESLRLSLSVRHPVYDCIYLALAAARQTPLITADGRFVAKLAGTPLAAHVVLLADWTG